MPTPSASPVEAAQIHFMADKHFRKCLKIVAADENMTMGELLMSLSQPEITRRYQAIIGERRNARG